jgi:hypothetical protein
VFLLSLLARFSWDTAIKVWYIFNIIFTIGVGWILLKILGQAVASGEGMMLLLLIMVQLSTREALELGQTSLLITLCMFASMLLSYRNRVPWRTITSGILLGLALSKPLLSFPLLLLFLYRRHLIELIIAASIQVAGILGVVLLGTAFPQVISGYFRIFMMHAGPGRQDGMYLTAGLLKGWLPYSYFLVAAGSLVLFFVLIKWLPGKSDKGEAAIKTDLILLTALMLWNLLVFYHRRYDYVAISPFLALIVFLSSFSFRKTALSFKQRLGIYSTALPVMACWVLPLYRVMSSTVYRSFFNLCTLAALGLVMWILFQLKTDGRNAFQRAP